MKKIKIGHILRILGLLFFLSNTVNAQNSFSQNTTNGLPSNAWQIDVADYDNDGDIDVLYNVLFYKTLCKIQNSIIPTFHHSIAFYPPKSY